MKKHDIKINTIDYRRWCDVETIDYIYYDSILQKKIELNQNVGKEEKNQKNKNKNRNKMNKYMEEIGKDIDMFMGKKNI